MDSSSSTKKNTKLSVKNQTCFKKSSFSSNNNIPASRKKINMPMREQTIFNKAYELTTLCDIEVCVIYYGSDGELIKTWPDDQHKVRDMAQRFAKLNENERRKKSSNLSQILNKKVLNDKKTSLDNKDNKFYEKVSDLEKSLENHLKIFQAKLLRLQTEPVDHQSRAVSFTTIEEPHQQPLMNHKYEQDLSHTCGFTTDLSPLPIDDRNQQLTESLMGCVSSTTEQNLTTSSSNQQQNKFSIFLYNHGNGSFCQLPDSVSSFDDQAMTPYNTALLGPQGFGLRSSNCNNMVIPPQMQTQSPLVQFDQFAAWNQTSSFGHPMMFSSYN